VGKTGEITLDSRGELFPICTNLLFRNKRHNGAKLFRGRIYSRFVKGFWAVGRFEKKQGALKLLFFNQGHQGRNSAGAGWGGLFGGLKEVRGPPERGHFVATPAGPL